MTDRSRPVPQLSLVVPVLNEQENVVPLADRVRASLPAGLSAELIFVDDGSRDDTGQAVRELASDHMLQIRCVTLSRNFGHQAALLAGMDHARGEAVITLDGDLQHPPELIPELLARWRDGAEVVQAVRRNPVDESPFKEWASRNFYRLLNRLGGVRVQPGAADFRLLSRPAVEALRACRERCRFTRGLVQWIGFRCEEVPFTASPRRSGYSKYSLQRMLRLAGDGIFAFSPAPLRLAGVAGALVSLTAAGYLVFVLAARLFTEYTVPGWSSILAAVLILGGFQLIVLWILGEYVGRLYEEVKQRPIYIVRATSGEAAPGAPSPIRTMSAVEASDLNPAVPESSWNNPDRPKSPRAEPDAASR